MTAALARAVARADGRPVLLGYSGGLDSGVLLHLLAADPRIRASGLRALHVHHGLHPDADAWAAHCRAACEGLRVPLEVVRVRVDRDAGLGPEGAAREARHGAFAAALGEGEVLALAHHRDDQAETLLLRALRGAGVDGLAAMRRERAFARGLLWRPLLDAPRAALLAYARAHGLRWIEDPGNAGTDPDRNFLRHAVFPLLRDRWPHAADALARSAALCAEAADLLAAGDAAALEAVRRGADTLDVPGLLALPAPRRARVLRRWVAELGLPP
ncbi:MAG TPA: tRNA lysidine(34) synthetase TilS, partial [Thermomonas sp.]|nr:tRNA lysidine(34) synthetase TilS [Thermomonas sp.]